MSESLFYHISAAGKLTHLATADAALAAAKDGGYVWLHYRQATKEELSKLIEPLGLHPLSIEDCFDENELPKIQDFPRSTFILFNSFDYSNRKLLIGEIDLFIGANFLVTVSQRNSEDRQLLDGIEHDRGGEHRECSARTVLPDAHHPGLRGGSKVCGD